MREERAVAICSICKLTGLKGGGGEFLTQQKSTLSATGQVISNVSCSDFPAICVYLFCKFYYYPFQKNFYRIL
jgi:hypothetical protein